MRYIFVLLFLSACGHENSSSEGAEFQNLRSLDKYSCEWIIETNTYFCQNSYGDVMPFTYCQITSDGALYKERKPIGNDLKSEIINTNGLEDCEFSLGIGWQSSKPKSYFQNLLNWGPDDFPN